MLPDLPPPTPIEIVGRANVSDGDTIRIGSEKIRLFGIDAPELHQVCRQGGKATLCGERAKQQLVMLISGTEVRCLSNSEDRYGRRLATCFAHGSELNAAMVGAGWAIAYRAYSLNYVAQEAQAKQAKVGLWSMQFEMPADVRREARPTVRPQLPRNPSCAIKGNISGNGQRIYHLPGSRAYPDVRIDAQAGERWFCSQDEALAAGWRPVR